MVNRIAKWALRVADTMATAMRPQLGEEISRHLDHAVNRLQERQLELAAVVRQIQGQQSLMMNAPGLLGELVLRKSAIHGRVEADEHLAAQARNALRSYAGLPPVQDGAQVRDELIAELVFLWRNAAVVKPVFEALRARRLLMCGQAYYNTWYLSRALRKIGWRADVLNWDTNPGSQMHYHGEDFLFGGVSEVDVTAYLAFYVQALFRYDIFHFSNAHAMSFGAHLDQVIGEVLGSSGEILLLKALGKKIAYSNNGCLDGVSQSMFSRWGPESVCAICRWREVPQVCSDERNLRWGAFRNAMADYQATLGGNRADYNDDPRVHECPWFYCMDPEVWSPALEIPAKFLLERPQGKLWLYHAVGNRDLRTNDSGVNIKSSHIWLPMIDRLREQGWDLGLLEPDGMSNLDVRYLQLQADVFLEMLTYGWFGANAREAMMLGKPVICYIRPEWLESVREELPEYADELPVISATPASAEEVLLELLRNPEKRAEIGGRSREFMIRWHSGEAAGARMDEIYRRLLRDDPVLRQQADRQP